MTLPISQRRARLRLPNGHEELLLREASPETRLALHLLDSLAEDIETPGSSWETLPLGDFDTLLLQFRRLTLGDRLLTDTFCSFRSCGERFDLSFSVENYLSRVIPRQPSQVIAFPDAPGWWTWREHEEGFRFRFPTARDLIELEGHPNPERALQERCLFPANADINLKRKAARAMAVMAPPLSGEIAGECPHCGRTTLLFFDPQTYCLHELKNRTLTLYEEVHRIAQAYGWSENAILSLSRERRVQYAEYIQNERGE